MTIKELLEGAGITLTQEQETKLNAEFPKAFKPADVYNADVKKHKDAAESLQAQLTDRDKQLESLKKSSGDNEALKQQIAQLQETNKTAKAEYDAGLKKLTINGKIETALIGAKARDIKAARALLDEGKISLDGENVLGLTDQLDALKKDKAWLFGEDTNQNPPPPGGGSPTPPDTSNLSDEDFYAQAFKKK